MKGNSSVLKFQCVFNQEDDEQNFGELVRAFLKHLSINVAGPLATSPEQVSADAIVLFFQFLGTTRFIEKSTDRFKAINRAHPSGQRVFVICFHHGREVNDLDTSSSDRKPWFIYNTVFQFLWLKSEETPYLVDCEKVRRSTKQLTDKFQSLKEK